MNEGKIYSKVNFSNILNFFGANNTEAMDKIAKFKLNFLYFLSFSFLFRCGNNCNFGIDGCGRCVVSSISAAAGTCPGSNTGQPKWKWKTFFIYSHFQRVMLITLISLKMYFSVYLYPACLEEIKRIKNIFTKLRFESVSRIIYLFQDNFRCCYSEL